MIAQVALTGDYSSPAVALGAYRWRRSLFKEQLIFEQSAARTVREQQEKRRAVGRANH
jgi:hypothetical protein